jgi:hypothetical protein
MSRRPDADPVDDQPTVVQPAVEPPTAVQTAVEPEPTAEQIVAKPAVDGDLEKEMRAVAQPFTKLTLALGAIVVIAVAFGAGAWTHAAFGSSSTSSTAGARAGATGGTAGGTRGGFTGGQTGTTGGQTGTTGATGTAPGGARAGRGTIGTIDRVDGTTLYIKTFQGTEVTVSTSDSTQVGVTQPGKVADLKPGASVTVTGATGSDGTVTAQSITQQPARAGG